VEPFDFAVGLGPALETSATYVVTTDEIKEKA